MPKLVQVSSLPSSRCYDRTTTLSGSAPVAGEDALSTPLPQHSPALSLGPPLAICASPPGTTGPSGLSQFASGGTRGPACSWDWSAISSWFAALPPQAPALTPFYWAGPQRPLLSHEAILAKSASFRQTCPGRILDVASTPPTDSPAQQDPMGCGPRQHSTLDERRSHPHMMKTASVTATPRGSFARR